MRNSSNAVLELLEQYGPGLTTDLAAKLRNSGISAEAARKRLSRLPEQVRILRGIGFPKRARFIYLEEQFGSPEYWDALIAAIRTSNPSYAAALAGMQARRGIIPIAHFPIVSGAPLQQKRHLSSSVILEGLARISLLDTYEVEPVGECVVLNSKAPLGEVANSNLRARLLTEDVLLDAIRAWAGKLNFASANTTTVRNRHSTPQFGTFAFDICGPSYLYPVRRQTKGPLRPGFFVCDVIIGVTLTEIHVQPFLRKCQTLSSLRNLRPFIPVLIADSFEPEALRALRSVGIMATTPSALFGDDVGRALKDLFETLSNAAAIAATDPARLEALFSKLSKIEGAAKNLRGALFELLVGHMVREIEGGSIDIGQSVYDAKTGGIREIDVRQVSQKRVNIYECRGYQPTALMGPDEVETWLTEKIPVIYSALRKEDRFSNATFNFGLWTTGKFHPDAVKLLKDAKSKTRKYGIDWRDGPAVRKYSTGLTASRITKILDEHYLKHPLSDLPVEVQSNPEELHIPISVAVASP